MTEQPLVTTRTIGEAENALGGLLAKVLAGRDLSRTHWIALRLVVTGPASLTAGQVAQQLIRSLKLGDAAAAGIIDDLRALGVLDRAAERVSPAPEEERVALTPTGMAVYQRINDEIERLTQRMWAGLDPADLAAAHRVLTTITERANTLLAS